MTSIRQALSQWFNPVKPLPAGVYHYQSLPDESTPYRLHLRIEPDGSGLLIVNASTILHLNQSATEYAFHLVNQTPADEVGKRIARRYRVATSKARLDYQELTEKIKTLIETQDLDPEMFLNIERITPRSVKLTAPYRLDCAVTYRLPSGVDAQFAPTHRAEKELSTEERYQILDKAWEVGIPHVIFTGGEPTLRDDLTSLLIHAEKNGQVTGLLTDGLALTDPSNLEEILKTGLDHAMILLNPSDPLSWSAVEAVLKADLFLTVHVTITLQNVLEGSSIVDRLSHLGVTHLSISAADESLAGALFYLRDQATSHGIALVWDIPVPFSSFNPVSIETREVTGSHELHPTYLYIEPDGDARYNQGDSLVLGNFLTDSWEKIWQ
jgi:hypothetical protein